eukprot:scaffold51_cov401-Prasinococcus_capsulatus_cf.AAC.42
MSTVYTCMNIGAKAQLSRVASGGGIVKSMRSSALRMTPSLRFARFVWRSSDSSFARCARMSIIHCAHSRGLTCWTDGKAA